MVEGLKTQAGNGAPAFSPLLIRATPVTENGKM
jgi:hypothetical protein